MSATPRQLSISDKRQIIYSSLLKYSPDAASLRDRALDRVVLGAMLGSTPQQPLQLADIVKNIAVSTDGPHIRNTVVWDTLERLSKDEKVHKDQKRVGTKFDKKKRTTYHLTEIGSKQAEEMVASGGDLFEPALDEILENTGHYLSREVGGALCRKIILRCFACLGRTLAMSVANLSEAEPCLDDRQIITIAHEHLKDAALSPEGIESFSSRLLAFFRSRSSAAERLKFHLAQGYYFTELLGLEQSVFNPLAEQSFRGAVFYVDANVLLMGILETDNPDESAFAELARITQKVGIQLKVSRMTLTELQSAAEDRITKLERLLGILPKLLLEQTDDSFIAGYERIKNKHATFTLDDFRRLFREIDTIAKRWNIEIDEEGPLAVSQRPEYHDYEKAINDEALASKGKKKAKNILHHDASHCVLIRQLRDGVTAKAWFLTRDGIVARAARKMAGNGASVCFSFVGFLQSISPFLTSVDNEKPMAEIISDLIATHVANSGPMFNAEELSLFAEYHSDAFTTPDEQLILALDYVRSKELGGHSYEVKDLAKFSLGLKTHLNRSKDQRLRDYETERLRLQTEAERSEAARKKAEQAELAGKREIESMHEERARRDEHTQALNQKVTDLESTTVPRKEAIWGLVAGTALLAGFAGLVIREWVLLHWFGSNSQTLSVAADFVFLFVALSGAVKLVPLFGLSAVNEEKAYWVAVAFPTIIFLVAGKYDSGWLRNGVDVIAKVSETIILLTVSQRLRAKDK